MMHRAITLSCILMGPVIMVGSMIAACVMR